MATEIGIQIKVSANKKCYDEMNIGRNGKNKILPTGNWGWS